MIKNANVMVLDDAELDMVNGGMNVVKCLKGLGQITVGVFAVAGTIAASCANPMAILAMPAAIAGGVSSISDGCKNMSEGNNE